VHTGFLWGILRERDRLEDRGIDADNIKMDLQEVGCGAWTEFRTRTGGGLL
jgi:hypothetical protein